MASSCELSLNKDQDQEEQQEVTATLEEEGRRKVGKSRKLRKDGVKPGSRKAGKEDEKSEKVKKAGNLHKGTR